VQQREVDRMDDSARQIPTPPTSTRDWLISAVLIAVIVAALLLLFLGAIGQFAG
jgi:hypothetical protein